ncbi:MAG: BACON domain-containing protein [Tannerellaceae bacterium]|jgi:hypothetical protein|nr:BACON domain-containing protein [Tannerellaceae bacterium]
MKQYSIFLLFAALFFSCVDDEQIIHPVDPVAKDKEVVLTMHIPGTHLPVTYAYSEADENDIRTVDALIFRVDASGNESYYRHITVPAISQDNSNTKKVQVKLELVDSRVIVLANARHLFTGELEEQLRSDSIRANATKEKVMQRFVFDMSAPIGKEKEVFPMYGESEIIRSADHVVKEIKMIRAITRIDIINSIPDGDVEIDSVYLFNTKNKGFIAPSFDSKGMIIETPNVPGNAEPNKNVFGYKFLQNAGTACPTMEREIYITEDSQDSDAPTLVVLKILRQGHAPQFYRVDMLNKDGDLLPVQRNYRYRINITKIINDGYPTVEAAVTMPKPSLSSSVETNELGISTVVFNDQYKLGVSTTDIVFRANGSWEGKRPGEEYFSLKVHTTYSGWSAEWVGSEPAGWVTFTEAKAEAATVDFPSTTLALNMNAAPNTTGKIRVGKIRLTAGTLRIEVNVTQYQ